jgi:hypothetical protein
MSNAVKLDRAERRLSEGDLPGLGQLMDYLNLAPHFKGEASSSGRSGGAVAPPILAPKSICSRRIRSRISSLVLGSPPVDPKAFAMPFDHRRQFDEYRRTYGHAR